jgi:PAS domain S-box-containing protein
MVFINMKGRVVYANQKCEEIIGYKKEEFYSPDFDFFKLIAPESRELVLANFDRHMIGEEVSSIEYTLITRDGRKIEAILMTKLIEYEGEKAILGTVTDITEYKNLLKLLKDSEEKHRNVTDNCLNGIHIFQDGHFKFVNETFLKLTGYTREELATMNYTDLIYPDDRDAVSRQTEQAIDINLDGLSPEAEFRCVRKSGEVWWVHLKPCIIQYENRPAILATSLDITDRKKIEEQVEFQANLVANVSDAIISTDRDFNITSWNKGAELVYGFSAEEAIGKPVVELTNLEYPYDEQEDVLKVFF